MNEKKDFKSLVAEVKLAYNLVEVVENNGIRLKNSGVNQWKGLCPFHNEKTPSFIVNEHFQNYRCFGCGASGDVINFIENTYHLDFLETIKKLASEKNINLDSISNSENSIDYSSMRKLMRDAANFYYKEFKKLSPDHLAVREITSRNLNPKSKNYGYAPEGRKSLSTFLKSKGYTDELIIQSGVARKFDDNDDLFDFWNGRLMFFITDITGKVIGFSGKKLYENDKRGKYVNSIDGPLFNKSSSLYNISNARKPASEKKSLLIAEGQFDVISLAESGYENTVASLGTAFTEKHGLMARRLVSESGEILFCFDGDEPGIEAAMKVFYTVPIIHNQSYAVLFPENTDPCDYSLKHGKSGLREFVENNKKPLVEFVLDQTAANYDLDSELGKAAYLEKAITILNTIQSVSLQQAYVKRVALDAFVDVDTVKSMLKKTIDKPISEKELTPTKSDNETIVDFDNLLKHDLHFEISSRLVVLSLLEPQFLPILLKISGVLHESLVGICKDLKKVPPGSKIIPELFTDSDLVDFLLSRGFFSLIHLMDEETRKEQFNYLFDTLRKIRRGQLESSVKNRITKILDKNNGGVELLERALKKESEELERLRSGKN